MGEIEALDLDDAVRNGRSREHPYAMEKTGWLAVTKIQLAEELAQLLVCGEEIALKSLL